jgi:hypothetical protein
MEESRGRTNSFMPPLVVGDAKTGDQVPCWRLMLELRIQPLAQSGQRRVTEPEPVLMPTTGMGTITPKTVELRPTPDSL